MATCESEEKAEEEEKRMKKVQKIMPHSKSLSSIVWSFIKNVFIIWALAKNHRTTLVYDNFKSTEHIFNTSNFDKIKDM